MCITSKGENNDFRIYTKAGVKFDIVKNLSNTTEVELRTKGNTSNIANYRFTTQFGYKFNKYFSVGAGYSLIGKPASESTVWSNRYWIDAAGNLYASQFTFSLRERFQQTFTLGTSAILLRSEFKIQYQINKSIFKPFISCEPHIYMFESLTGIKELRCNLGTSIAINKNNDLQVYGRYTRNFYEGVEPNHFILGINYYFKF
jgi:hypothetical protein